MSGRLILVSNRLPVTVVKGADGARVEPSAGGLATALRELHEESDGVWVGWPGPTEGLSARDRARVEGSLAEFRAAPIHLTDREVARYYETFSNGVLWPVFHYATGVLPLRLEGWEEYETVNRRFADAVAARHRPGDAVWVHDYQLMRVPAMLRERHAGARIGFFLHTPFPSAELFSILPRREDLLHGLLGADLIGFHTAPYRRHFEETLLAVLGLRVAGDEIRLPGGRVVRLGVFPIGTDPATYARSAERAEVVRESARLRASGPGPLLVGIDRLDYTKGIPRRLLAFEELLGRHPVWRERARLVQVAVPSRTGVGAYRRLREEVDALVGRVNGAYGTPHWLPVHYLHRSVTELELLALYRAADVMLVTPVRDGMNLVAKEFVASRADGDGVLVLSEFAGAAEELREAVMVNPFDVEGSAAAYHRALTMPAAERRARMKALRARVADHDVRRWAAEFLAALGFRAATPALPPPLVFPDREITC